MPLRDVVAMNESLDNDYDTRDVDVALFYGDPMTDGVEIVGNGYARITLPSSGWDPAVDGMKSPTDLIQFPAVTAEWPDSPSHWALFDGSVGWDCGPLTAPIDVTGPSSVGPALTFSVFYADAVVEEV